MSLHKQYAHLEALNEELKLHRLPHDTPSQSADCFRAGWLARERNDKLLQLCKKFIEENRISCAESIYQTDRVIENATTLIEEICDLVGYIEGEKE